MARRTVNRFRLVRSTHLFASSVREALEEEPLRRVTPFPLTLSHVHLLKLVARRGRHQVGQVAHFLGVSPPAATRNVDKLERLGLLSRLPRQGDRRATLVAVSPKARRLVRDYERAKRERLAPVLATFAPEEVRQFAGLLERFAVALFTPDARGDRVCLRCGAYLDAGCPIARVRGGCPYPDAAAAPRRDGGRA